MSSYDEPQMLPSLLLQFVLLRVLLNSGNFLAIFEHIPLDDYRMQTHSSVITEGT